MLLFLLSILLTLFINCDFHCTSACMHNCMLISGKVTLKLNVCKKKNHALSLCITSMKDSPNYRMCTIPYIDPIVTLMHVWCPRMVGLDPSPNVWVYVQTHWGMVAIRCNKGWGWGNQEMLLQDCIYISSQQISSLQKSSAHGGKSLLVHAQVHCLMEGVLSCKGNTRKSQLSYAISSAMDSIFGPSCSTFLSIMDQCGLYIL